VARWPIETKVLSALRALPGKTSPTILQVPALPRNANGKVRRDRLVAFARQQRG
jgi:acyl-coenzyme A synthetase/AMP-(fatty) acid ligase